MEILLLLVAPALIALTALLLVTFGIGTCYAGVTSGFDRRPSAAVPWASVAIIAGAAAAYCLSMHRLPRPDARLREAFDVEVPVDSPWLAMLAVACLGIAAAALVLMAFGV